MPTVELVKSSPVPDTFRVAKVQGMFDIPRRGVETVHIHADLPLDERPWQIGLITGASGTGKSTVASALWPDTVTSGGQRWTHPSLLDDFPDDMSPKQITDLLVAVGLSSSPVWLRPYRVLSTGQQFRADLARSMADAGKGGPVVFDEFTSTVDRTVAKTVAFSLAKHIRRTPSSQFVAVTCHRDVAPWLQTDWTLDTDTFEFCWGSVQPRPPIGLEIREGLRTAWPLFRQHHYLTGKLSGSCRVFLAFVTMGDDERRLAGFFSILPSAGHRGWWRGHRTVVLPDFQGVGIGNRMIETVAEQLWRREHKRFRAVTSAPGIVFHRRHHPEMWRLARKPSMAMPTGRTSTINGGKPGHLMVTSAGRLSTSWVYLPEELRG